MAQTLSFAGDGFASSWPYVQGIPGWYRIMVDDSTRLTSHNGRKPRFSARLPLEEEVSDLLPLMPALFSTDLPPCDPISQKAYGNTVWRLRAVWIQKARFGLVPMHPDSIYHICSFVLRDLEFIPRPDNELYKHQLYWAAYFVREAEWLRERELLSQQERQWHEVILEYTYPVPKELYVCVKNRPENKALLNEWRSWQRKKRGPLPRLDEEMQQELMGLWKAVKRTRETVRG